MIDAAIIQRLKFDAYYLEVYSRTHVNHFTGEVGTLVYLHDEHKAFILKWLKDNYHKLSDQYKPLVNHEQT